LERTYASCPAILNPRRQTVVCSRQRGRHIQPASFPLSRWTVAQNNAQIRRSKRPNLNQVGRARCCTSKAAARPTTPLYFREVVVAGQLEGFPNGMMTRVGVTKPTPPARTHINGV
jgi:hypothetical protein